MVNKQTAWAKATNFEGQGRRRGRSGAGKTEIKNQVGMGEEGAVEMGVARRPYSMKCGTRMKL